jgi:hypothetical protein
VIKRSAHPIVMLTFAVALLVACAPSTEPVAPVPAVTPDVPAPSSSAMAPATALAIAPSATAAPASNSGPTAAASLPEATPDPAARVIPMTTQQEKPVDLAQQLAYIPPQAGGVDACMDANAPADQKLFVASKRVGQGDTQTICYQGIAKGEANEKIVGPDGKTLRTYRFPIDADLVASDFVIFPDDQPGIYTIETQTPAGVLKTTYEVTDEIVSSTESPPFIKRLYQDRFSYWPWDASITQLRYIFVGNFPANTAIEIGFYEGCRLSGWRRFGFYGRNLLTSAQARVNGQGYAFLPIPQEIAQAVGAPKPLSIVVRGDGSPQNVILSVSDPLRHKREILRELVAAANSTVSFPPAAADGYGSSDLEEGTELPICPAVFAPASIPADLPQPQQQWRSDLSKFRNGLDKQFILDGQRIHITAYGAQKPTTIDATNGANITTDTVLDAQGTSVIVEGVVYTSEEATVSASDLTGRQRWKTQLDQPVTTPPLLAGNTAYVGDAGGMIAALDKATGSILARFKAPIGWESVILSSGGGGGVIWGPSLGADNDTIYLGGEDSILYALNEKTGAVRWSYNLPLGSSSAPVVVDGIIYVGGYDGYLYALDSANGQLRWRFAAGDWVGQPHVVGESVVFTTDSNRIFGLSRLSGELQWSDTIQENIIWSEVTPDGDIVLASATPTIMNLKLILMRLKIGAGENGATVGTSSGAQVPAEQIRVTASGQAPNGIDKCQKPTTFDPTNVVDGDPGTAWRISGDGKDAYIQLEFDTPRAINEVQLIPGYSKVDSCSGENRFTQNRRIKRVALSFSDGSSVEGTFRDEAVFQAIQFKPIETKWVRITILDTFSQPPGEAGRDYTPMSEITVLGNLP